MINKRKKKFSLVITLVLTWVLSYLPIAIAQTNTDSLSSVEGHEEYMNEYNRYYLQETSFAGHKDNPLELLRGRLPGLLISRPGSDPNGPFDVRLRGFNTLLNDDQPLYIVDGVPDISLSLVDPADVVSFEIYKGASAAHWGMRSSRGVIDIQTRKTQPGKPVIRFRSYVAAEQPGQSYNVLDATGYKLQQENTSGSYNPPSTEDNNWIDVITRTSISTVNNLSLSGGAEAFNYRASLNLRNVDGIALNTGYDKLNGRIRLGSTLMDERLEFGLNLSGSSNRSKIGFEEAFGYAVTFNPMAPRKTNAPQFGGYHQQQVYDYYNPLAILEQNQHDGTDRVIAGSLIGTYHFDKQLEGFSAHLLLSEMQEEIFRGEFSPAESYFRGYDSNGYARTRSVNVTNHMADVRFNWSGKLNDNLTLDADVGYSAQNQHQEYEQKEARNLPDAESYTVIEDADINTLGGELEIAEEDHKLAAFYSTARISNSDVWYVDMGLRYEGAAHLGRNNKWGIFPYLKAGYNLDKLLNLTFAESWMIRGGYGLTGNLPRSSGWSEAVFEPSGYYYSDGQYLPSYSQEQSENPDLRWESTAMWNGGFDFAIAGNRIRSSFDLFLHQSTDLIINATLPVPPYLASSGYLNMGGLTNSGLEITIQYDAIRRTNFSYSTEINYSTIRTSYNSLSNEMYSMNGVSMGYPEGGGCSCSTGFITVKENEPAGQFYGPVFEGIDDNGEWILRGEMDYRNIGNGLPSSFLGWTHSMSYRNWKVDLLLRGVFGHDIISVTRMFYENKNNGAYNILERTPKNLNSPSSWNSYYVEDGDYIKFDNLTFSYRFPLQDSSILKGARIFASVDNLLTITGYSGVDPSERLSDRRSIMQRRNGMAPGIDRRSTWLDSRTFMAGVDLRF